MAGDGAVDHQRPGCAWPSASDAPTRASGLSTFDWPSQTPWRRPFRPPGRNGARRRDVIQERRAAAEPWRRRTNHGSQPVHGRAAPGASNASRAASPSVRTQRRLWCELMPAQCVERAKRSCPARPANARRRRTSHADADGTAGRWSIREQLRASLPRARQHPAGLLRRCAPRRPRRSPQAPSGLDRYDPSLVRLGPPVSNRQSRWFIEAKPLAPLPSIQR